jgi:CRISPR type I-E-associated protein CasB/Cse2
MTATATADAEPRTQDEVVRDLIAKLAQENFGTGPLAELRRMDPRAATPTTPTLHRLLARNVPEPWLGGDGLNRWALLIHLLALAAPSPQHDFKPLGRALFTAGYNEGRLTALLEALATDFPVVLPRMVRFLVAKGGNPHPYQLARLVLGGGREVDRMTIARAFYRAEARSDA